MSRTMERTVLVNCTVLVAFCLLVDFVFSQPNNYDTASENTQPKESQGNFWFGPRLGRRKRNPFNDGIHSIDRDQLESLMDAIQDSPWAVVAINDARRHTTSYTPRLGRESGEDMGYSSNSRSDRWLQDGDTNEYIVQRSPPFAPRLGRRMSPYSPRLGRENDKLQLT